MDTASFYPEASPACHYERDMCHGGSRVILDLLLSNPSVTTFCELGSFVGSGVKYALSVRSNLFICAVDLWDNAHLIELLKSDCQNEVNPVPMASLSAELKTHPLYETFLTNVWEFREQVLPLRMDTVDGLRKMRERGVVPDVIFIDSSHCYEKTRDELETANELFPDAVLCGDDFGHGYIGIVEAVHEFVDRHGFKLRLFQGAFLIE